MACKTYMLYKGKKSDESTESAAITFSADAINVSPDGNKISFANKDGSVGMELTLHNGAKLREIIP